MKQIKLSLVCVLLMFGLLVGNVAAQGGYEHSSGAFSLEEFLPLEEEIESGALFSDETSMAVIFFGVAPIEITEELAPWIARPLLDTIPEFEDYELAEMVDEINDGLVIHFTATPMAEAGSGELAGDVFMTRAGEVLYLALLISEDYEAVADDWLAALEGLSTVPPAAVEAVEAEAAPAEAAEEPAAAAEAMVEEIDLAELVEGVLSSGFEPTTHGFGFENYGDEINPTDLTPAEMQRMFGDVVCADITPDGCVLTPAAQQWMEENNSYMGGGHCYGMAALSTLMYYNQITPAEFGGSLTSQLPLENEVLQREIAYWWAMQGTYPAAAVQVFESPAAVVETLAETFEAGQTAPAYWVIGFYKRDWTGGHAVTPIGLENLGNGLYHILVYDNNFPGETRIFEVDVNANTWQYEGSPFPEIESDLYEGDADSQTLSIIDLSNGLQVQECDFCAGDFSSDGAALNAMGSFSSKAAAPEALDAWQALQARWDLLINGVTNQFYQIWLTGDSELLVVDDWDRRIGRVDGEYVNEIPGASRRNMVTFQSGDQAGDNQPPVYRIPVGLSFEVLVDATNQAEPGTSDVSLIGSGYYLDVTDIWLEPGEMDILAINIDKSHHQLNYFTDYSESPVIELGVETEEADYGLWLMATELIGAEDSFDVALDTATGEFILNTSYNTDPSTFELYVRRFDEAGEYVFGAEEVVMDPDNTAFIAFRGWEGPGSGLPVELDFENDGEIDEYVELPDVTGEVEFYEIETEEAAE